MDVKVPGHVSQISDIPLGGLFVALYNGKKVIFVRGQFIPDHGEVEDWVVPLNFESKVPEFIPASSLETPGFVLEENVLIEVDDNTISFDRSRYTVGNIILVERDAYIIARTWTNHLGYVNLKSGSVTFSSLGRASVGFSGWSLVKREGDNSITLVKHSTANHNLPS